MEKIQEGAYQGAWSSRTQGKVRLSAPECGNVCGACQEQSQECLGLTSSGYILQVTAGGLAEGCQPSEAGKGLLR